jgi:hypothetical protein
MKYLPSVEKIVAAAKQWLAVWVGGQETGTSGNR